jgi:hypothetical protein
MAADAWSCFRSMSLGGRSVRSLATRMPLRSSRSHSTGFSSFSSQRIGPIGASSAAGPQRLKRWPRTAWAK